MLKNRLLAVTALAAGTAFAPAIAWAQTTPEAVAGTATNTDTGEPDRGTQNADNQDQAIVVTGSRIRQPNLESNSPITVVTGAQLFETGQVSIGDVLNELPQLRPTFSQQNSTRFLGTRGLNLLDLRGLGSERTLVLVNGRRHVAGDILSTGVSVDVNTIPTDLVDRIDVVTGGLSSIYGSDAIGGVVNFVLKQNYDGFQIRGQSGASVKYSDAGNQFVSALAGKNFADGRGNIALALEFAHQSQYTATGRPQARQDGFVVTDTDPASAPSDGIPDRTFYRDIRSTTIFGGGLIAAFPGAAAPCGTAGGTPFTCNYLFQPDGSLVAQTGQRVGIGPNGSFLGGNGQTGREGALLTLTPDLKRYSANMIGHFDFSPAAVAFFEAKYVRSEAFGSQSGPFFTTGATLADDFNRERPRLDNPFLSTQARALLTQQFLASTVNPNSGGTLTAEQLATQRAAILDGSYRFTLRRNFVDLGIRDERIRRETYRIVGGLRGDFNDDWNYELSANYGEYKERNVIEGNVNVQRYLLAIDSVRNPATGQVVCRSQISAAAAQAYVVNADGSVADPARLAADIAACVPVNPFGQGAVTQAARDYLLTQSRASGKITQFVANGFVAGDLSQLFELPGGPVAFSVGGEYRRETNKYDLDDTTQQGYAFYNAIPSFSSRAFEVKEAFGEISIPIVKDLPLLRELTISGSGRISDYRGAAGTVYTYGGGVSWRPIQDLRLRGVYNRAVRAPNLGETFSAQSQNYATVVDPCSARNIATGTANRAANCAAAGIPTSFDYVYQQTLEIRSGGNPDLREEKSDSYTAGFVFTPSFVPGLSISSDYYDITVKNVISSVSAQNILNLCYDSPSLQNQFCGLFQRYGAAGGSSGQEPFRIIEGSLLQSSANFARLKARGVDTNVAYRRTFGWGALNLNGTWTRTIERSDYTNPDNPNFENRILGELADPKNRVSTNADVKFGKVTVGYQMRWIDKMYTSLTEDFESVNGNPPQNPDSYPVKYYPDVFYHDARVNYQVSDRFDFYLGVDNIGNKMPPFGLTGVGAGSGIYDIRGRYGYAGFSAKF
jgi:outer membrane receptor protein involved in Fe transport